MPPLSLRHRSRCGREGVTSPGFSLLEILLVLGIAAALIIAAFVVYPKAQASLRATTELNNLNAIASGLRSLYAGSSDYSSLGNGVATNAKVFPDSMVSPTGAVTNSWGGDVSVNSGNTLYVNGFQIDYSGVPADSCTRFVTAAAANFSLIYVNGTQVKNMITNVNLDVPTVSTACNGVTNTVTFWLIGKTCGIAEVTFT